VWADCQKLDGGCHGCGQEERGAADGVDENGDGEAERGEAEQAHQYACQGSGGYRGAVLCVDEGRDDA
jgi:hypothetical protein